MVLIRPSMPPRISGCRNSKSEIQKQILHRTGMEPELMRILMVTSFPIPGTIYGTAMLPIKIMRALKVRGVQVVMACTCARPPWRTPDLHARRIRGDAALHDTYGRVDQRAGPEADRTRAAARACSRSALRGRDPGLSRLPTLPLAFGVRSSLSSGRRSRARPPGPWTRLSHVPGHGTARLSPRSRRDRSRRARETSDHRRGRCVAHHRKTA